MKFYIRYNDGEKLNGIEVSDSEMTIDRRDILNGLARISINGDIPFYDAERLVRRFRFGPTPSIEGVLHISPVSSPVSNIKRVIFNDPATIVFWKDGTKTVAKAQAGDLFDKKRGIVVCMLKKLFGGGNAYNKLINSMEKEAEKWVDKTNA